MHAHKYTPICPRERALTRTQHPTKPSCLLPCNRTRLHAYWRVIWTAVAHAPAPVPVCRPTGTSPCVCTERQCVRSRRMALGTGDNQHGRSLSHNSNTQNSPTHACLQGGGAARRGEEGGQEQQDAFGGAAGRSRTAAWASAGSGSAALIRVVVGSRRSRVRDPPRNAASPGAHS